MKIEFTAQPAFSKGTNTPSVARTVLQAQGLLDAFPIPTERKVEILAVTMTLMKHFIACEEVRERVSMQIAAGRAAIETGSVSVEREQFLQLPGVTNLEPEGEAFLHNAKLALADIGRLFGPLHGCVFDHKFQKIRSWLRATYGENDPLLLVLTSDAPWIERVINMRNVVEHPGDPSGPLVMKNFHTVQLEPLIIADPEWALGSEPAVSMVEDMGAIVADILTLYEDVLCNGILRLAPHSPFTIVEIPEAERDPAMPLRLVPGVKGFAPSANSGVMPQQPS
jgi:hypothetical protein